MSFFKGLSKGRQEARARGWEHLHHKLVKQALRKSPRAEAEYITIRQAFTSSQLEAMLNSGWELVSEAPQMVHGTSWVSVYTLRFSRSQALLLVA